MVKLQKLTYKNFMSVGNAPITIQLDRYQSTAIIGKNGAGKSLFCDALFYALFNKALRNIPNPKLINSINQSDCLVSVEFSVNAHQYKVIRGMKPAIFEIYEDDHLIPSPASSLDYQTLLENTILHLNRKSFQQVVILAAASYIPFMKLTPAQRRTLIEDLLDIEIFSSMSAMVKDDISVNKGFMDECTRLEQSLTEQLQLAQSFTDHLEEQRRLECEKLNREIDFRTLRCQELERRIEMYQNSLSGLNALETAIRQTKTKQHEYEKTLALIGNKEKKLQKEESFYTSHDVCPTCEQSITQEFKLDKYQSLTEKLSEVHRAQTQCQQLIDKYVQIDQTQAQELQGYVSLKQELWSATKELNLCREDIDALSQDLQELSQKQIRTLAVDPKDLEARLSLSQERHQILSKERHILDAAGMLLKDNGIKARVVKHYLPIINKTINTYLAALDFPIQFVLNEEFEERLLSRYRDQFEYDSFSEGEKRRIDIALLLTWRAIARLKNSASTNILVLDEIFDSSLDAAGADECIKIITNLEEDTHVFVISHRDAIIDKFANHLMFQKSRGFTEMVNA